jgi:predicted nucleic acid-binding Zn ribbon protein
MSQPNLNTVFSEPVSCPQCGKIFPKAEGFEEKGQRFCSRVCQEKGRFARKRRLHIALAIGLLLIGPPLVQRLLGTTPNQVSYYDLDAYKYDDRFVVRSQAFQSPLAEVSGHQWLTAPSKAQSETAAWFAAQSYTSFQIDEPSVFEDYAAQLEACITQEAQKQPTQLVLEGVAICNDRFRSEGK